MVYERMKIFNFTNPGSLTADANGNLSTFTRDPIRGEIRKISIGGNNYSSTGSLYFLTSGVVADVLAMTDGVTQNKAVYPAVGATLNNGAASSSTEMYPVSNDVIQLAGSGLGAGTSGLNIRIYYK